MRIRYETRNAHILLLEPLIQVLHFLLADEEVVVDLLRPAIRLAHAELGGKLDKGKARTKKAVVRRKGCGDGLRRQRDQVDSNESRVAWLGEEAEGESKRLWMVIGEASVGSFRLELLKVGEKDEKTFPVVVRVCRRPLEVEALLLHRPIELRSVWQYSPPHSSRAGVSLQLEDMFSRPIVVCLDVRPQDGRATEFGLHYELEQSFLKMLEPALDRQRDNRDPVEGRG